MLILGPADELYTKRKTAIVPGLTEIRSEIPFIVRVGSFCDTLMRLEAGRKIGYGIKALHVRELEGSKTKELNQECTVENTGAAVLDERSACQEPSMYSCLCDERTSEASKQTLALKFEDRSE